MSCGGLVWWVASAAYASTPAAPQVAFTDLVEPTRMAVDEDGTLYVTDTRAGVLAVGPREGAQVRRVALGGRPFGVALDGRGRVLVGDVNEGSVRLYDSALRPLSALGVGVGEFVRPSDIAVHNSTGLVYTTDSGADLVRVHTLDGAPVQTFDGGEGETHLSFPTGIAVDGDTIWVVSHRSRRLVRFDLDGNPLSWFGIHGEEPGELFAPQGVWVDGDGRVWVADARLGRVTAFDPSGIYLGHLGRFGTMLDGLRGPSDLAMSADGWLVVASAHDGKLTAFSPESYATFVPGQSIRLAIEPSRLSAAGPDVVQVIVEIEGHDGDISDIALTSNGLLPTATLVGDRDVDGAPDVTMHHPTGALLDTLPPEGPGTVLVTGHIDGIYIEQGLSVEIVPGDPPGSLVRSLQSTETRACGCASAPYAGLGLCGVLVVWPALRRRRKEGP